MSSDSGSGTHPLIARINFEAGCIRGISRRQTKLSDLKECFADADAFREALAANDVVVYEISGADAGAGEGDLHYGLGKIMPGRIGREYFLTKGHLHAWRPAAEVYISLRGQGRILLEDEKTGEARMELFDGGCVVYVPGHTAHRTVNTGDEPLIYLGICPARAGHDYETLKARPFAHVVIDRNGEPAMVERAAFPQSF